MIETPFPQEQLVKEETRPGNGSTCHQPCHAIKSLWGSSFCSPYFLRLEQVGGGQGQVSFAADRGQQIPMAAPLLATTHPRDDKLPAEVLHFSLDLAADVELVAVEGDALKIGQQVLLAGRVWALTDGTGRSSALTAPSPTPLPQSPAPSLPEGAKGEGVGCVFCSPGL